MVQTLQAKEVTLDQLEIYFRLQRVEDEQFFREWQSDLPELTEAERQRLERVRTRYFNLLKYPPLLGNTSKWSFFLPGSTWLIFIDHRFTLNPKNRRKFSMRKRM